MNIYNLSRRLNALQRDIKSQEQHEPVYVEYHDEDSDTTGLARVFTTGDQQVLLYLPEIEDDEV